MEYLSLLMEDGVSLGNLSPLTKIIPMVTHLLYADDVMFFLEASIQNANEIQHILHVFGETTGLHINKLNSRFISAKMCINTRRYYIF